jgi:hypothetical protein
MTRSVTLYGMALLLLLFEVAVLAAALRPDVSKEYASYFIDRTSDCWTADVPGEGRLNRELRLDLAPTPWPLVAQDTLVCGWIGPASVGTWSQGRLARLRFRFDPAPWADVVLHLEVRPLVNDTHPRQRVEFFANGEPIGLLSLDAKSDPNQAIRLPAALIARAERGQVDLELHLPDAVSPSELGMARERRRLGIRLLSMRLETTSVAQGSVNEVR